MTPSVIISCFLSVLLLGCCYVNVDDPPPTNCDSILSYFKNIEVAGSGKPVCVVLCDFTSSMDDKSLKFVTEQAFRIFDHYYEKATVKFYPILNGAERPFFESERITITDTLGSDESDDYMLKHCFSVAKPAMRDSLSRSLLKEQKNRFKESYVVQSIENAIDVINQYDPGQKHVDRLIVLSDMRESGYSSFGRINLEDDSYEDDIKKVQEYDTARSSSHYIGTNLIINTVFYTKDVKKIGDHNSFWNLLFTKLGYSKPIILSTELPFED